MRNTAHIEQFGKKLKQLRNDAHFTQDALAFESGIDRKTIRQIEKGQQVVSLDLIISLARALKTSPAIFFEGMDIDFED